MTEHRCPTSGPGRSSTRRGQGRDQRGAGSLELALLFPLVMLFIFGVIQAAMLFHARNVALAAAQVGVREARVEVSTADAGREAASEFLADAGNDVVEGARVSATRDAEEATVTVTGRSISVIPGLPGFEISQSASAPVERFTGPGAP